MVVVLVGNVITEPGENPGRRLEDHLRVIDAHVGGGARVDAVLVHEGPIDADLLERYRAEGAVPLNWSESATGGQHMLRGNLVAAGEKIRHDPERTAAALISAWREVMASRRMENAG